MNRHFEKELIMKKVHVFRMMIICLLVSLQSLSLEAKEVKVIKSQDKLDLSRIELFLIGLYDVEILDCTTRGLIKLGDFAEGVVTVPEVIKSDCVLSFLDDKGRYYKYWIPSFRSRALINLVDNISPDCLFYTSYSGCYSMEDLGDMQFGVDCEGFNSILVDYCENSPVVCYPGRRGGKEYIDYSEYLTTEIVQSSTYVADFCNSDLVFNVCDDPASIENQSQFLENLNLAHLKGKKGTFTIRFAINCEGHIVETKLVDSKTNATRDEILNIFNNELIFIPAKHRERDVDSYHGMRFKIRNDWIKLIE